MPRHTQLIRWTRIICRMMDKKPHRLEDFADLQEGLCPKTKLRDLQSLLKVTELEVVQYKRSGQLWWRMLKPFDAVAWVAEEKQCRRCKETKSLDEFWNDYNAPDGKRSRCIECFQKQKRTYVAAHYDKVRAAANKWRKKNRNRVNEKQREYYRMQRKLQGLPLRKN